MDQEPVLIGGEASSPVIEKFPNDKISLNKSPLVLIADDHEDVLAFVASCLKDDYIIEMARNGLECENIAYNMIPDLIVLDVMMPFKDGFEVCKTLNNNERTSHIPIIMLTAKDDFDSRLEGLEQGADAYLTKPILQERTLVAYQKAA